MRERGDRIYYGPTQIVITKLWVGDMSRVGVLLTWKDRHYLGTAWVGID